MHIKTPRNLSEMAGHVGLPRLPVGMPTALPLGVRPSRADVVPAPSQVVPPAAPLREPEVRDRQEQVRERKGEAQ